MARFLDTNILLYSVSTAGEEAEKRRIALELLAQGDIRLSVQVLQEFYVQATRPCRPRPMVHRDAADLVKAWTRFPVEDLTVKTMERALEVTARHGISYWDAAVVAAAEAAGADTLLSEDLGHGQRIGNVRIVNPIATA